MSKFLYCFYGYFLGFDLCWPFNSSVVLLTLSPSSEKGSRQGVLDSVGVKKAFIDITWAVMRAGPTPTPMTSILVVLLLMKWPLSPEFLNQTDGQ